MIYKKTIKVVAVINNEPFEFEFKIETEKSDYQVSKIGGRGRTIKQFTTGWKSEDGSYQTMDGKTRKESIGFASRMEAILRNPKAKSIGDVSFSVK